MDDKKKKFAIPEAIVLNFINDEIITLSGEEANADNWIGDDNTEEWQ